MDTYMIQVLGVGLPIMQDGYSVDVIQVLCQQLQDAFCNSFSAFPSAIASCISGARCLSAVK